MGIGYATMEEFEREQGVPKTTGFSKYILPTAMDIPEITGIIVEDPDPLSPLHAKGIGEPAILPTAPAIIHAIYDAVGVRITTLPASPERVLKAIREKEAAMHATHQPINP
jgi:CO/xanthine dehydrogenase Mo-binding subunit